MTRWSGLRAGSFLEWSEGGLRGNVMGLIDTCQSCMCGPIWLFYSILVYSADADSDGVGIGIGDWGLGRCCAVLSIVFFSLHCDQVDDDNRWRGE
jgi:hypothetical protein